MPKGVFPAERTEKKKKKKNKKNKKKQVKQRDAGVCSIKSEMRYPSFNGTRGCAKLAQKHAMENGGKTRKMAENTIKLVVLGKIE